MATNRRVIIAQRELHSISSKVADTATARKLFILRKKLDEIVEFVIERQQANMDQTGVSFDSAGRWVYPDDEARKKFDKLNNELLDMKAEFDPVTVKVESIPGLSINDIAALDGFVDFMEE